MTKKLLLNISFFLMFIYTFAQPIAHPVPNLGLCGSEVFDLTVQIPVVLGNQNPEDFTVSFHTSVADANNGVNAIINVTEYVAPENQIVYIRVTDINDPTLFAIRSFMLTWDIAYLPPQPDVAVCDAYILPALAAGEYRTEPDGGGVVLPVGSIITSTQEIYIYLAVASCIAQENFTVEVGETPAVIQFSDIYECYSYVLPPLPHGNYYTEWGGTGIMLSAGDVVTATTYIYWYSSEGLCNSQNSFMVFIGEVAVNQPTPMIVCSNDGFATFNLNNKIEEISGGNSDYEVTFHLTYVDAHNNVNAIATPTSYTVTDSSTQIIYVRFGNADCAGFTTLQLSVSPCSGNKFSGVVRIDADGNGCTSVDEPASNVMLYASGQGYTIYAYTNELGEYAFDNMPPGATQVRISNETLINYNSSPFFAQYNFAGLNIEYVRNWCLAVDVVETDGTVYIMPTSAAVPGFETQYFLVVYNNGSTPITGTATFNYDSSKLTYSSASSLPTSSSSGTMTFDFTNLAPLQSMTSLINLIVAVPPAANIGDINIVSANIETIENDVNAANNQMAIHQTIVSSYDPNEIEVVEGPIIEQSQVDDYLHYIVRFQNEGSSKAVKVVIKTQLDLDLDWSTFIPAGASHHYMIERKLGLVTFTFDNINLVPMSEDEAGSQGFVTFRVKAKPEFAVGDVINATADIFFDFNAPITTNTVSTQLETLANPQYNIVTFKLWPNPASEVVYVTFDRHPGRRSQMMISDISGKMVYRTTLETVNNDMTLDVSGFQSGIYFVKISSDGASALKKLIIR